MSVAPTAASAQRRLATSRLFGVSPASLPMTLDGTYRVPRVLVALRRALLAEGGASTEGVFRVAGKRCSGLIDVVDDDDDAQCPRPGNEHLLAKLCARLETTDDDLRGEWSVHELATVIKRFYGCERRMFASRQLFLKYQQQRSHLESDLKLSLVNWCGRRLVCGLASRRSSRSRLERLRESARHNAAALALLGAMPADEQALICYLLEICADVVRARERTRMTARNCAVRVVVEPRQTRL